MKARVRTALYGVFARALNRMTRGNALILPGPGAPEVPLLFDLGYMPGQIVAVDTEEAPLAAVHAHMPAYAQRHGYPQIPLEQRPLTYEASLLDYMKARPRGLLYQLVNLDLMSQISDETVATLRAFNTCLTYNAVVAITYPRGREIPGSYLADRKPTNAQEDWRQALVHRLVTKELTMDAIYRVDYISTNPMTTQVFQRSSELPYVQQVFEDENHALEMLDPADYARVYSKVVGGEDLAVLARFYKVSHRSLIGMATGYQNYCTNRGLDPNLKSSRESARSHVRRRLKVGRYA